MGGKRGQLTALARELKVRHEIGIYFGVRHVLSRMIGDFLFETEKDLGCGF
jgi:hypothetical protein